MHSRWTDTGQYMREDIWGYGGGADDSGDDLL